MTKLFIQTSRTLLATSVDSHYLKDQETMIQIFR